MTDFVDVISVIAVITGFVQMLGPAPDAYAMLKQHSAGVTPIAPLAAMFACSWIWATYGVLNSDIFPLAVNSAMSVCFATVYISIFYRYTLEKSYAHKVLAAFALVVVVVTVYAVLGYYGHMSQSRESVKNVMGYIGNVVIFIMFLAPFENVAKVFRYRTGAFIPINIVCVNVLNASAWLSYSLMVKDWLIVVPNAGALVIGSIQMSVYMYFHPSTHPLPEGVRVDDVPDIDVELPVRVSPKKTATTSPEVQYAVFKQ